MANSADQVARILYKQIVAGDRRKAGASSNDTASGGGARDFRFPYEEVLPAVEKIFPQRIKRRGKIAHQGTFFWHEEGKTQPVSKTAVFMSPTNSRPSEGWISQVPKFSCFNESRIPESSSTNRVFLLLVQRHDDSVWPHFAEEKSLRTKGEWDPGVAQELLNCMDAKRAANRAVIGYIDFTDMRRYCNEK